MASSNALTPPTGPQAVAAVQHRRGRALAQDPHLGSGIDQARLEPPQQERQPDRAVPGLALQLGLDQAEGDRGRILLGHVQVAQRGRDEQVQAARGDDHRPSL